MKRRRFLGTAAAIVVARAADASSNFELPNYDVPKEYMPRLVDINEGLAPFEIHILPQIFAMYWTQPGNRAVRYTVGIGRPGLYEPGQYFIGAKKEWPSWTPTSDMIAREPEVYEQFSGGMPGGLDNPLGARAFYLFTPERGDTFLRIHGTNDPKTVASAVSNGCARLVNDQIVRLYESVPLNTRVVLYPNTKTAPS